MYPSKPAPKPAPKPALPPVDEDEDEGKLPFGVLMRQNAIVPTPEQIVAAAVATEERRVQQVQQEKYWNDDVELCSERDDSGPLEFDEDLCRVRRETSEDYPQDNKN